MLAISSDSVATLKKFRSERGPDIRFAADPKAKIISLYGVKTPLISFAQRTTFVIDQAGVIQAIFTGNEAIDQSLALKAVQKLK